MAVQNKRLQGQLADARKSSSDALGKHSDARRESSSARTKSLDGPKDRSDARQNGSDARGTYMDARTADTDAQPSGSDHRTGPGSSGTLLKTGRPASAKAAVSNESTNTHSGTEPGGTGGIPGPTRTKRASSDGWPEGGEGTRRGLEGFGGTISGGSGEREKGLRGLGANTGTGHEDKENAGSGGTTGEDHGRETHASSKESPLILSG